MKIRKLTHSDMREAVRLEAFCWPEETAGLTNTRLNIEDTLAFYINWMDKADENDDVRLLLGAFENEKMLGVAFGSFIESKSNPQAGIELNGLWIYPECRRRGISFALLKELLTQFWGMGAKKMIVYNYHCAPSNTFYRHLGCKVTGTETQTDDHIPTDIFTGDIASILDIIRKSEQKSNDPTNPI